MPVAERSDDKNVIIEAANEHNISAFECHKVLSQENGILRLMEIAKKYPADFQSAVPAQADTFQSG